MSDDPRPDHEDNGFGDTLLDDQSPADGGGSGQTASPDRLSPQRIQGISDKINQVKGNQKRQPSTQQKPQNKGHFPDQKDQSRAGIPEKKQPSRFGQQAAKGTAKESGKQAAKDATKQAAKETAKQTEQAIAKKVTKEAVTKGLGIATGGTGLLLGTAISLIKKRPFTAIGILIAALAIALVLTLLIPMFVIVVIYVITSFFNSDASGQAKGLTVNISGPERGSANEHLTYTINTRSLNPVSNIKVEYRIPSYTRFYSSNPTCVEMTRYDPSIDPCAYTRSGSSVTAITWNTQANPDPAMGTYSVTIQVLPGIEDVKIVNLIDAASEEITEEEAETTEGVSGPIP